MTHSVAESIEIPDGRPCYSACLGLRADRSCVDRKDEDTSARGFPGALQL